MKKRISYLLLSILLITTLNGCSFIDDLKQNIIEDMEWTKENGAGGEYYNEEIADAVLDELKGSDTENDTESSNTATDAHIYNVGDQVTFTSGISVTVTNWGSGYDSLFSMNYIYFDVEIANNGSESFTMSSTLFSVYADNYVMDITYTQKDSMGITTIDPGRMANGRIYVEGSPDTVQNLEIQLGDTIWVLKGNVSQNSDYSVVVLEDYVNENMTTDEMKESLTQAGFSLEIDEDGDYVTNDYCLAIIDTDLGVRIYISEGAEEDSNVIYSIYGLYCGMTLEEAEEVLNDYGAVDFTYEDDRAVRRYRLFDKFSVMLSLGESSIDGIDFGYYLYE